MSDSAIEKLVDSFISSMPEQIDRTQLQAAVKGAESVEVPNSLLADGGKPNADEVQLQKIIGDLSIPQKIKLAMFGNLTARSLLIRDSNRQIPLFVLQNPRLTDNEITEFARNTNLSDQVLRAIGNNTEWMKSYNTKVALISNPKTPIDASVKWIKYLNTNDLRRFGKSKNIPQVVSNQCKKMCSDK